MTIVIALDGVLRSPTGDLIHKGLVVYRAMKAIARVVLVTEMPEDLARGWLLINNILDYDDLVDSSVEVDPEQPLRHRQLAHIRSQGPVMLYVEADPVAAAEGLASGLSTLLFAESEYSHYAFRPDRNRSARPWDELVAERTRQQALLATDTRVKPVEMGLWE